MVVWTVLDLLGLILDRTDGEGQELTALHQHQLFLIVVTWNSAQPLVTMPGGGRPSPIITVPAAAEWWQTRLALRLEYTVYRLGLGSSVSADGPPTL
jgi:hypothetical protein